MDGMIKVSPELLISTAGEFSNQGTTINTLTGETYSSMRKLGTILGVPKTTIMKKLNNGGYNEYKLK